MLKFSVNYKSKYKEEAGEIKCPWNKLGSIFDFIESHPRKRYNITIEEKLTEDELNKLFEQLEIMKSVVDDYTIETSQVSILNILLKKGYPSFLNFSITDWELLQSLIEKGVSDILIDGPLCFNLSKLNLLTDKVNLRISPVISPNVSLIVRNPKSFFVRPEDIHLYDGIINYVDFLVDDIEKENALFSIYNREAFFYDINSLIPGLPQINNSLFKEDFAQARINCGQKCKIPGYTCNYCTTYFSLLENMLKLVDKKE